MDEKKYAAKLERKLIDQFKQTFYDKLGFYPIVLTRTRSEEGNTGRSLPLMGLEDLESFFTPYEPERFGEIIKLKSQFRYREIVELRQIFCAIAGQMGYSLKTIGHYLGGRDHTTAIHSIMTFNDLVETSEKFNTEHLVLFTTLKKPIPMTHQLWTTLIRYQISPNQLYYLDCLRYRIKPSMIINENACKLNLQSMGYITPEGKLSEGALQLLEEFEMLLVKTKRKVALDVLGDEHMDKIKEYREMFPAKRLGSGSLARQNVKDLKTAFIWFFKTYPEFDWDIILDATQYYVMTKERENWQYMINSQYFIQKTDNHTKASKSELANYCQLILDNPDVLKNAQQGIVL